jgi:hypothetical protein
MSTRNDLVTTAALIMEYRGYDETSRNNGEGAIDIVASERTSDKEVLVRVVTGAKPGSSVVGVDKARKMRDAVQAQEVETGIIVSDRFTVAGKRVLKEHAIEFYTTQQPVIRSIDADGLYVKINAAVKPLCEATCGKYPSSAAECQGITTGPDTFLQYPCRIRQLSDNADVHYEHRWYQMLRTDLRELLTMVIQTKHPENDDDPPLDGRAEPQSYIVDVTQRELVAAS